MTDIIKFSDKHLAIMERLREIDAKDPKYPGQIWFVMEEAAEVQKEFCKVQRAKGNPVHFADEMMDLFGATMLWFYKMGYSPKSVLEHVYEKWQRSIDRYDEKGEY